MLPQSAAILQLETVGKRLDDVALCRSVKCFAAFAQLRKHLDAVAGNIDEVNFSARVLFVAEEDRRSADVFKARVLDPQARQNIRDRLRWPLAHS